MIGPSYLSPSTMESVLQELDRHGSTATIIAGGTDLLPRLRAGETTPANLIDLRLLPLDYIVLRDGHLRLGSRLTHTQILSSSIVADHFPALVEACRQVAGPTVRNRGTLGGNLANASPAADSAPPLLVYDASVVLTKLAAQRILPLADFFVGPGQTALEPNELLTEVLLPLAPANTAAKFIKLGKRQAMAVSVLSVAARLTVDANGKVMEARIALGSVAPTPVRATVAERILRGRTLTEDLIVEAAGEASKAATPITDLRASAGYRREMVEVLVKRALREALAGLPRGGQDA